MLIMEKKYKIVLQNRVRPSTIKKASDNGGPADYWYIEDGKDIRLYSIYVKECLLIILISIFINIC